MLEKRCVAEESIEIIGMPTEAPGTEEASQEGYKLRRAANKDSALRKTETCCEWKTSRKVSQKEQAEREEVMGGDRERVISWKPNEEKRRGWVSDVTRVSRRHNVSSKFNMWMSVVVELRSGCCRRGSK